MLTCASGFASRDGDVPILQRDGEETFDHRVDLLRDFELVEVPCPEGHPNVDVRFEREQAVWRVAAPWLGAQHQQR